MSRPSSASAVRTGSSPPIAEYLRFANPRIGAQVAHILSVRCRPCGVASPCYGRSSSLGAAGRAVPLTPELWGRPAPLGVVRPAFGGGLLFCGAGGLAYGVDRHDRLAARGGAVR